METIMEPGNFEHGRTIEEVRETLELAAVKESDLRDVTQIIYSSEENEVEKNIKLLELDEHLIQSINNGDSITFKGGVEDSVVLCTKNRTYDIREAETSNSCLLVPNLIGSKEMGTHGVDRAIKTCNISGIFHTYYEVKGCMPKVEKLLSILQPTSFKGIEYESSVPQEHLYDWQRLKSEIQASEDELSQALNDHLIANIDGYFRLISFEAEIRSLTLMLDLFDENSWELDEVDKEGTYESLKEFILKPVFDILFRKYAEASEKSKPDGAPLYRYNEEQCCKSLAKILLTASSVTEYKQFMESWHIGTPEKMEPKEEYLSGIALVTWNSSIMKKEVVSFPETDLPKDINQRFNELFKAKDKWTVKEITPYISNSVTRNMNVNALLTKYARCSTINGITYYSAKHGK